jgi:O-antigen/teichoic acid export membrane protein
MKRRLGVQTVLSWTQIALELFAGFIIAPVIIRAVGLEDYGVWAIANSTLILCALVDLGLRGTLFREVCIAYPLPTSSHRPIGTLVRAVTFAALVGVAICSIVGLVLPQSLPALKQAKPEDFALSMFVLSLVLPLSFWQSLTSAVLAAAGKNHIGTIITISATLVRIALCVLVLPLNASLLTLALIAVSTTLVSALACALWASKHFRFTALWNSAGPLNEVTHHSSHATYSFTARSLATVQGEMPVYFSAMFLGAAEAGIVSILMMLFTSARKLTEALGANMAPMVLKATSERNVPAISKHAGSLIYFGAWLSSILGVGFIVFGGDFLALWVGHAEPGAHQALQVLGGLLIAISVGGYSTFFLDGLGRYWWAAGLLFLDCVGSLVLTMALAIGVQPSLLYVVLGYAIPKALVAVASAFLLYRVAGLDVGLLLSRMFRVQFLWIAAALSCAAIWWLLPHEHWLGLIASSLLAFTGYTAATATFMANAFGVSLVNRFRLR